jgi:AraC-like DNA-binding protein
MSSAVETISNPQMRVVSLHNYIEVGRFLGLDPYRLLSRAKVRPEELSDPENRVPAAAVARLYDDAVKESGCQAFALLMAECRSFASLGPISLLLRHQPTARDVVKTLVEHVKMFNDVLDISLEEDGGQATIRCNYMPGYATRPLLELAVALTYRAISETAAGRWRAASVHFSHSAPTDLRAHRRVFACPVRFDSEYDGIACSSASLDLPNPAWDPELASHARQFVSILEAERPRGTITDRVRHSIYLLLPDGDVSLQRAADNLGIHPRMLQRLLEREGGSFASLLNEIRRELALRRLTDSDKPITEIAMLLGYSAPSSFTRWFTEEFGKSPAAWRKADADEGGAARARAKSG